MRIKVFKTIFFLLLASAVPAAVPDRTDSTSAGTLAIPPRPSGTMTGAEFIRSVVELSVAEREQAILHEISNGNIPEFLRRLVAIETPKKTRRGNGAKWHSSSCPIISPLALMMISAGCR